MIVNRHTCSSCFNTNCPISYVSSGPSEWCIFQIINSIISFSAQKVITTSISIHLVKPTLDASLKDGDVSRLLMNWDGYVKLRKFNCPDKKIIQLVTKVLSQVCQTHLSDP